MISRRHLLKSSAAALCLSQLPQEVFGYSDPEEGEVIPFLNPQAKTPNRAMIQWDQLTEWETPEKDLFSVAHYNKPQIDGNAWKLSVSGLVKQPRQWTLDELKKQPRKEFLATLECSGNGASPAFMGAVGNMRWTGTSLASLLKECGLKKEATEIVFFGADEGKEKIKDNEVSAHFGRSLTPDKARGEDIILAYELNGKPLSPDHGFPVRLVVPGWYGVAWVKWLERIEAWDHRYMGRFMARDYVTLRGEEKNGQVEWCESSVGPMNNKSIVARVVKLSNGKVRSSGAAWNDGTPLKKVEVQLDGGPWIAARLHKPSRDPYAWTFFSHEWQSMGPGEHTIVSRAIDEKGRVQPAAEDPRIALKKTYYEANQQILRKFKI